MRSAKAALHRLCDPDHEVSAHYLIAEDGQCWHLVEEAARAWHAGKGAWGEVSDVNSRSIGIELANTGQHPFPEPQMTCLEGVMRRIMADHDICPERVIAHSDLAPDRKQDPGRSFDWQRLARGGLAVWPAGDGDGETDFLSSAAAFGYVTPSGGKDASTLILDAFRQRFCPAARGPQTHRDRAMMQALARDYPVDRTAALP
ncbi:N-acetylmuramoyl-L-alanine amidase [Actibacterium sp. 188UL27-1]|uniref:N-acetylmuramoyl-L-alanine amidase n=1 Tax=Actibacterium sp. 188UL27-1 TaxID=2786961 RepID=UPI00195CA87A|nr:N-acetylmuramoyl-L-alanine amidase [Actibacterium sp. 188UL27-1]MBM7066667.1 N-acetylmuramoyl-L-alanine amidase [Actibacterium sp. 188UL27-1]